MIRVAVAALLGLGLGLVACGDNIYPVGEPLATASNLTIIAHQDDDLLFMQPDEYYAVNSGTGVTNVYVTAGNGNEGVDYAERRYAGLRASYASAAGATLDDWSCGWISIAGHMAQHCRLDDARVSLVFLAYPDGLIPGTNPHSLLNLWEGNIASATTVSEQPTTYDQPGLIATIAEIITTTAPSTIFTLEIASTHGYDHTDHMIVGALAVLGAAAADTSAAIVSYRGYSTQYEPVNQLPAIFARASNVVEHYDACTSHCAPCGDACPMVSDASHVTYLSRRYAVGMRRGPMTGVLTDGTMCVQADHDGSVSLVGCDPLPPAWTFRADGGVQVDATHCLQTLPTGELGTGDCAPGAARTFRIDDEGHIWTGSPPTPVPGMDYEHLNCLAESGGKVRAVLCGQDHVSLWALRRGPLDQTPRASIGLTATGRAVQLGDLDGDHHADLCSVSAAGLVCAPGDGSGSFGAPIRIDNSLAPLAIEPTSLALGDIDGDGRADACGRDAQGILCATAANNFSAARFSTAFAATGGSNAADRSLAIVNHQLCGFATDGVTCLPPASSSSTTPVVISTWPAPDAPVWIGDLDGDGGPDWCSPVDAGPSCAVAVDHALTTDGESWGFSAGGVVEGSSVEGALADDVSGALADVDGDGRADLCTLLGDQVGCALSNGHGFDPRIDEVELAAGSAPDSLWLGDLDGDGKADICVADSLTITCSLTP